MTEPHNSLIDPKDFDEYEKHVDAFLKGELDPHRFVGIRLNLGVYAQRQEEMCMVRAKLPGGRLGPHQLLGFAEAVETYSGSDSVHITTRQDIQFHYIPLEQTPQLQRHLATYAIGTREAGGNTVRNITGCPLSGACPAEHVDINSYIDKVANHFVRHPLTASLPRKFKISFSGCESDCSNGLVHDLGVIATAKEGQPGFRLLAGGGLGGKPKEAIVLREFVPEQELIPAIEALLSVHDKHSDRKRRMRSRIKFLVERFGAEEFIAKFDKEFERTLGAFSLDEKTLTTWRTPVALPKANRVELRTPVAQRQQGLQILPISVPDGELNITQLRGLAELLVNEGLEDIRTTQDQNLSLFHVPESRLESIRQAIEKLNLTTPVKGDRVVSCPGTATCPLGITASRHIAPRLSGGPGDLAVRINGCQNGCANATISDIGLYGKGRRHHGILVPSYTLQLGGDGSEGGGIGISGPDIPAVRVPSAVQLIHDSYLAIREDNEAFKEWVRRQGKEYFEKLLSRLSNVGPMELPFLTRDHGDSGVFKVESQGVGECAGAQAAPADKLLLDARYEAELASAFATKHKHGDAAECLQNQFILSSRSLLESFQLNSEEAAWELISHALNDRLDAERSEQSMALYQEIQVFNDNPDELQFKALSERNNAWMAFAQEKADEVHLVEDQDAQRFGTDG